MQHQHSRPPARPDIGPVQTSATMMNTDSSRSHTILRLRLESSPRPDASDPMGMQPRTLSYLNIIDLAGSESAKVTLAAAPAPGFTAQQAWQSSCDSLQYAKMVPHRWGALWLWQGAAWQGAQLCGPGVLGMRAERQPEWQADHCLNPGLMHPGRVPAWCMHMLSSTQPTSLPPPARSLR